MDSQLLRTFAVLFLERVSLGLLLSLVFREFSESGDEPVGR